MRRCPSKVACRVWAVASGPREVTCFSSVITRYVSSISTQASSISASSSIVAARSCLLATCVSTMARNREVSPGDSCYLPRDRAFLPRARVFLPRDRQVFPGETCVSCGKKELSPHDRPFLSRHRPRSACTCEVVRASMQMCGVIADDYLASNKSLHASNKCLHLIVDDDGKTLRSFPASPADDRAIALSRRASQATRMTICMDCGVGARDRCRRQSSRD